MLCPPFPAYPALILLNSVAPAPVIPRWEGPRKSLGARLWRCMPIAGPAEEAAGPKGKEAFEEDPDDGMTPGIAPATVEERPGLDAKEAVGVARVSLRLDSGAAAAPAATAAGMKSEPMKSPLDHRSRVTSDRAERGAPFAAADEGIAYIAAKGSAK